MDWLFSSYGFTVVLQVLALVHYFRNRPEWYWFFVIVFVFPPIGPIVYLFVEVLPGWNWRLPVIDAFERKKRRQWLEKMVVDAPTQETMARLATMVAKEGDHERAVQLFTDALDREPDELEARFGRGASLAALGRPKEAVEDLRRVVEQDPSFKFYRAALELAAVYETLGEDEQAAKTYQAILDRTTVSGAYYGLGALQAKHGNQDEAKRLLQEILAKQPGLPRYLRRQERPWVRKAKAMLKTLGA